MCGHSNKKEKKTAGNNKELSQDIICEIKASAVMCIGYGMLRGEIIMVIVMVCLVYWDATLG